jgi:hypothetical protein
MMMMMLRRLLFGSSLSRLQADKWAQFLTAP